VDRLQSKKRISYCSMKILVSVPNTGYIHKQVVFVLLRLQLDTRYKLTIILPTHNPYENNLHHIVKDFAEGDYDFWLNIDSDNPPLENPLDLVELDKDILGLPTPVVHMDDKHLGDSPVYLNAYDYVPEKDAYKMHTPTEGLQKVDAVGTGCVLYSKRVFENPKMRQAPFLRKVLPDGRVDKGNDISFCERARENGFEIWAHYVYQCRHYNEVDALEMDKHYKAFFKKNPI